MRIGVVCRADELAWAQKLGFRFVGLVRFPETPMAPTNANWKTHAEKPAAAAKARGIRISSLGSLSKNPLDPRQTEFARGIFHRAIEVASHMGVSTVGCFPGAVIETTLNERGGNPIYKSLDESLPQLLAFWEPVAKFAADKGVRIAFEHCPQGQWFQPIMGYNAFGRIGFWEKFFDAIACDNIGLEWDASHLVCQFIDPVENIHRFGSRIFHVHAKDAFINRHLLAQYGICHPGVIEHRFPGLWQSNWAEIVHALLRAGYDSDLNIEGWHDPVFRNQDAAVPDELKDQKTARRPGLRLEEAGLQIARRTLEMFTAGTE